MERMDALFPMGPGPSAAHAPANAPVNAPPRGTAAAFSRQVGRLAHTRQRVRRWMTGSLAVVMAAVAARASRGPAADDRRGWEAVSPHPIDETLQRIERSAQAHGLSVLARIEGGRSGAAPTTDPGRHWVIVLASAEGGTPVQVDDPSAAPEVPLAIHVEHGEDGLVHVRVPALERPAPPLAVAEESAWPDSVFDELAGLPVVIEAALA